MKIKRPLAQQKLLKTLEDPLSFPLQISEDQKNEMLEMATTTLYLSFSRCSDKVEERLFGFKMNVAKNLEQNLHDFLRMIIELANSGKMKPLVMKTRQ